MKTLIQTLNIKTKQYFLLIFLTIIMNSCSTKVDTNWITLKIDSNLTEHYTQLSGEEQEEQLRDWILLSCANNHINEENAFSTIYDYPSCRYDFLRELNNYRYGKGRYIALSGDDLIILYPANDTLKDVIIAREADKYRMVWKEAADDVYLYEYTIDTTQLSAKFHFVDKIDGDEFYSEDWNYFEETIESANELKQFLKKIDDVVFVEDNNTSVEIGGRKYKNYSTPNLSIEDIAAIYKGTEYYKKKLKFKRKLMTSVINEHLEKIKNLVDYLYPIYIRISNNNKELDNSILNEQEIEEYLKSNKIYFNKKDLFNLKKTIDKIEKQKDEKIKITGATNEYYSKKSDDNISQQQQIESYLRFLKKKYSSMNKHQFKDRLEKDYPLDLTSIYKDINYLIIQISNDIGFSLDRGTNYQTFIDDLSKSITNDNSVFIDLLHNIKKDNLKNLAEALIEISLSKKHEIKSFIENLRKKSINKDSVYFQYIKDLNTKNSKDDNLWYRFIRLLYSENSYQKGRYDGKLQGTEVGMTMFYTDLIMKLWAIDYCKNTPRNKTKNFIPMTDYKLSPLYFNEKNKFSRTRSWLAPLDEGYNLNEKDKKILFAPIATRIFSVSSDELYPESEVKANPLSCNFTNWWNNHYSDIADYESQYHRLNQIMKWSIILERLRSNGSKFANYLKNINITYNKDFEYWYKQNNTLKVRDSITFYDKDSLNENTECIQLFTSKPLYSGGFLRGGVSLGGSQYIDNRIFNKKIGVVYFSNKINPTKKQNYTLYNRKQIQIIPNKEIKINYGYISVPPKFRVKYRGKNVEYFNANLSRNISKKSILSVNEKLKNENIGNLKIRQQKKIVELSFEKGDVTKINYLVNSINKNNRPLWKDMFLKNSDTKNLIEIGDNKYLLNLKKSNKIFVIELCENRNQYDCKFLGENKNIYGIRKLKNPEGNNFGSFKKTEDSPLWKLINRKNIDPSTMIEVAEGVFIDINKTIYLKGKSFNKEIASHVSILEHNGKKVIAVKHKDNKNIFIKYNYENIRNLKEFDSHLKNRRYIPEEMKVISLVKDSKTNRYIDNNFSNNRIKYDFKKTLREALKSEKRKSIFILGHIENGSFVTRKNGKIIFEFNLNQIKTLEAELNINIFALGCNSGYYLPHGMKNSINSLDAVKRFHIALKNKNNHTIADFLNDFTGKGFDIILGQKPFPDLGYIRFKTYKRSAIIGAMTVGGGYIIYYIYNSKNDNNLLQNDRDSSISNVEHLSRYPQYLN